jgi:hypothetical protein
MYTVDSLDEVLNFEDVPGHSPGAPMPQILANDDKLVLAYEVAPSGEAARGGAALTDAALQRHKSCGAGRMPCSAALAAYWSHFASL